MNRVKVFSLLIALVLTNDGWCKGLSTKQSELTQCLMKTANEYQLDPYLIWAVKLVESSTRLDHNIIEHPRNGTISRGIMQINSSWDKTLLKRLNINPDRMFYDHCLNLKVGSIILADNIKRYGLLNGIAYYNTGVPNKKFPKRYNALRKIGAEYRAKVLKNWAKLKKKKNHYRG